MKHSSFRLSLAAILLALVFAFASCGAAGKAEVPSAYEGGNSYKGADSAASGEYKSGESDSSPEADISVKLIKTASLALETLDYDNSLSSLRTLVDSFGGYYSSLKEYNSSSSYNRARNAYIKLRIPSEKFDGFIAGVSGIFSVTSKSTSETDITESYYDTQSRLETYRAQEASLLEMLGKAQSIEEYLNISDYLTPVQANIKSLETQMKVFDSRVEMSEVELTVSEVKTYTPAEKESFLQKLGKAFSGSWSAFVSFLRGIVLAVTWALPFLIVAGAIIAVVLWKIRKTEKKLREHKDEPKDNEKTK